MCWYMNSLLKKLTSVVAADQLLCIGHGRRPVEICSESFADQGPRAAWLPQVPLWISWSSWIPTSQVIHFIRTSSFAFLHIRTPSTSTYCLLWCMSHSFSVWSVYPVPSCKNLIKGTLQSSVLMVGGTLGVVEKGFVMIGGGTVATRGWSGGFSTT
jgi:hypothetical protein